MFKVTSTMVANQAAYLTQVCLANSPINFLLLVNMTIGMMVNGKAILRNTCDAVSNPSILASLP